jgi:hypothetical protein
MNAKPSIPNKKDIAGKEIHGGNVHWSIERMAFQSGIQSHSTERWHAFVSAFPHHSCLMFKVLILCFLRHQGLGLDYVTRIESFLAFSIVLASFSLSPLSSTTSTNCSGFFHGLFRAIAFEEGSRFQDSGQSVKVLFHGLRTPCCPLQDAQKRRIRLVL